MANSRVSVNKKSCKCSFRTVRVETLERVAEVKDNSHTLRTLNLGLIVTNEISNSDITYPVVF